MTGSETARAIIFVSLALLGCLIRTYIRTANGEKEDDVHFWSSRFSQLQLTDSADEKIPTHHTAASRARDASRTATSSGEVSQAVSVLHDQPPRFAPFLAETVPTQVDAQLGYAEAEVDEAYEDWAAMHHARGAVSEDAEASIDNLLQRRQLQKTMKQHLPHLGAFDASGASTPTIWTTQFPAAQLRPY